MTDANETPVHTPNEGEGLSLQSSDPQALWDALTHDAEVGVLVVDTQGTIQFANAAVQGALGAGEVDLRGKSWHELLPKDVADERVRCAKAVVETSQPIALIGMIRGGCRCAIFRPIESDAREGARVLVICRPLTAMDREPKFDAVDGCAVVIAQFNDLGPLSVLTEREFEVLAFIGEGLSTAEIAQRLHRSVKTVEWHRRLLGSKLGATNRVELARIAIRAGANPPRDRGHPSPNQLASNQGLAAPAGPVIGTSRSVGVRSTKLLSCHAMRITVNGESIGLEDRYTVWDLIERYHLADRPCAVEINRQLVPKAHHREHRLTEGDEVEIVTLVGGG